MFVKVQSGQLISDYQTGGFLTSSASLPAVPPVDRQELQSHRVPFLTWTSRAATFLLPLLLQHQQQQQQAAGLHTTPLHTHSDRLLPCPVIRWGTRHQTTADSQHGGVGYHYSAVCCSSSPQLVDVRRGTLKREEGASTICPLLLVVSWPLFSISSTNTGWNQSIHHD